MNLRWRIAQWGELRWWKAYLGNTGHTEYLQRKRVYWQRLLATIGISPPPGSRVLDAGCGPAGIFIALDHCRVDALDPLLDQYRQVFDFFRFENFPYTQFLTQPLETLPPSISYDYIFCLNAINHVDQLTEALHRLVAALSTEGMLVLSVDVHRRPFLKYLFRLFQADLLHPHQHDKADYEAMLTHEGLHVQTSMLLKKGWVFNYVVFVAKQSNSLIV